MTIETHDRLWPLLQKVFEYTGSANGFSSYEESIAASRLDFQDKSTSPAAFIHKKTRELYPMSEPDSVRPENFYQILGFIDTKEKLSSSLASLPEESALEIEKALRFLLKEYLPSQREAAKQRTRHLPQRRAGGAPSKMPSSADCCTICDEINDLHRKGVLLQDAQPRVAQKWNKSRRTIQKVWQQRKLNY